MSNMPFLPYAHHSLDDSDREAVHRVLCSDYITRGPEVARFEEELAAYVGAPYAVAFSNGSHALHAAYLALDLDSSDTVISTPNTFIATVAPVCQACASLHLVDIDEKGEIDWQEALEILHEPRTRGRPFFVPVHYAGSPIDMATFSEKVYQPDLKIIEDAAHALGSTYSDGTRVGSCSHSDLTIFSFHPSKNITTGEGGAVTCVSFDLYEKLKRIRDSGIERQNVVHALPVLGYYEVPSLSSNYHMTEMAAALGRSQLKRIETFRQHKLALQQRYLELLDVFPGVTPYNREVILDWHPHLFVVSIAFQAFTTSRHRVMEELQKLGIGSQYHYVPLYYHDGLRLNTSAYRTKCPRMETHFQTALSLPFFSSMALSDVDRVVQALREVLFNRPFA